MSRRLLLALAVSAALPTTAAFSQSTPNQNPQPPAQDSQPTPNAGAGSSETKAPAGGNAGQQQPSSPGAANAAKQPPSPGAGNAAPSGSAAPSGATPPAGGTTPPSGAAPSKPPATPPPANEPASNAGGAAGKQPGTASPSTTGQNANQAPGAPGWTETPEGAATQPTNAKKGPDKWMTPEKWYTFNGDLKAQKYATSTQITPENVGKLQKVWEVHTGDVSDGSGGVPMSVWSATPLFVNDTLYFGTPFYRIFALAPDTGKVRWVFDTHAPRKALTQPDLKNRGVAYWQAENPDSTKPCQKIVYIGTMDAKLWAVDADTGKACQKFGQNGMLDVNQWNTTNDKWPLSLLQPPTVYHDTLYLGWAGRDWTDSAAPPGTVFALDAQTGKLKWMFHALPKEAISKTGTSNVWASMSIDPETGLLYIPISSPSPNFYGGMRKEKLPLATSVTALDSETGRVVWSRQLVHHDLWDLDTDSPPTLVDLTIDGKKVPALIQSSKQGFLYVLNRKTGEPIFPIDERKVPASDVPGEQASPTQPYVAKPQPTVPDKWPGVSTIADWVSFGYCSDMAKKLRNDGRFTPPSLKGTLTYPPTTGGVEWGGGAVDPTTGVYVVNSNSVVQLYKLIPRKQYDQQQQNGETSGDYAQAGAPYAFHLETFLNWAGMPCWKPPYGSLSAYDMNTGKLLWKEPFGQVQKYGFYMPESWGSVTIGAPVITKTGLIFIGASMDSRVRAIDLKSGEVLWKGQVDAPAVAMPAVYTYKGKEYVVFAVGGNSILLPKVSDQIIAYALPDQTQGQ